MEKPSDIRITGHRGCEEKAVRQEIMNLSKLSSASFWNVSR